jgi:hypothetical protein
MADIRGAIRDNLVTLISTIPDSGSVYNRAKYSSDWGRFFENFQYQNRGKRQIRGWWLTIPLFIPGNFTGGGGDSFDQNWETYDYRIRGIMSFVDTDDTEAEFEDLIYRVFVTLQQQAAHGAYLVVDGAHTIDGAITVAMPIVEYRMFGSTLCHYCEISYRISLCFPVV